MEAWIWVIGLLFIFGLKNMPLIWHFRFFRALAAGMLVHRKAKPLFQPSHIFLPAVSASRSPPMECDFNLHKSNSTYFTDLDVSRAYLSGILFGPLFLKGLNGQRCNLIVGAVACSFRREIKPYRAYETWTRIASWDDKWIYMVTHFVSSRTSALPPDILKSGADNRKNESEKYPQVSRSDTTKGAVLASAVTQFVCKQGRRTVPPAHILAASGLLNRTHLAYQHSSPLSPSSFFDKRMRLDDTISKPEALIPADVEAIRRTNLLVVQLQGGWGKVHELFQPDDTILGCHKCI
ncbi:uncharacterized protein FOBCDRAFT_206840 [Fusarium oxysporum Fo47]|uniref:uncharacterized protein n=1 Tax=Fusarium oxysporum Fo47 TaxID=660027 RepID=UPI002869D700|nr:uncharacterized protein FOBCDRAFT_206840 [Fusarium oxysporum Fo47]WJG36189.1 hypothetical protein FOBCDRAFT_206840 [Fusarium oxysporum Fo47]